MDAAQQKEEGIDGLPVIDLALPTAEAAASIRAACSEDGFFYLRNHGVDAALISEALAQCRAFFALPLQAKLALRAHRPKPPQAKGHEEEGEEEGRAHPPAIDPSRGYSPYQSELLNAQEQRQPCTQEGFRLLLTTGQSPEADAAAAAAQPWPDPAALPEFLPTLMRYHSAMEGVAYRVTQLLLQSVGLPPDYLHDAFHPCSATTRLLHYPPVVSVPEEGIFGCGAHTDWGCLTLLVSDEEDGLEVQRRRDGAWVPAPSRRVGHGESGGGWLLLCNVGDLLQRWTNDCLRSTPHRVVNRRGRERYSIPFFYSARPDAVMECLPPFRGPEQQGGKYPPIRVKDYIAGKYRDITRDAAAAASTTDAARGET